MDRLVRMFVIVLLTLLPARAAADMRLERYDCGGDFNAMWTCTGNSGTAFTLVGSFIAPAGLQPIGQESIVEFAFVGPVPEWWHVGTGECRLPTAMQSGFVTPASGGCVDYFGTVAGGVTGSHEYLIGPQDPGADRGGPLSAWSTRVIVRSSVDSVEALQMATPEAGDQVFLFTLTVNKTRTTGTGACAGCVTPGCAFLRSVTIQQPAALGPHVVTGSGGYPINLQGGTPDCYVGTNRTTWGQVKTLYR